MVEEEGFEPSKSLTTDLQSAPFGHSGTPPIWMSDIGMPVSRTYLSRHCAPSGKFPAP